MIIHYIILVDNFTWTTNLGHKVFDICSHMFHGFSNIISFYSSNLIFLLLLLEKQLFISKFQSLLLYLRVK